MKAAPRILGISGYARVGKSTFARALAGHDEYTELSFAQPLRDFLWAQDPTVGFLSLQVVVNLLGWEKAKDQYPEVRRLLQTTGTQAGRKVLGDAVWVDKAMKAVDENERVGGPGGAYYRAQARKFVFADVRFPNEADAIKKRGGIIVRIEREGVSALNDHDSETAMDDYEFDYVIRNNGTVAEFRQKAFDLVAKEQGTYVWPPLPEPIKITKLPAGHDVVLVPPNVEVRRNRLGAALVTHSSRDGLGYAVGVSEPLVEAAPKVTASVLERTPIAGGSW